MADIRHSIQIAAPVEKVFPLVATASGFKHWWAEDIIEKAGSVELGFFRRATVYRLKLIEAISPHPSGASVEHPRAEWSCESGKEWSGTRIKFDLRAEGSGIVIDFAHSGWVEATSYFVSCNTTWGALMFRLKAAAEGKKQGPLFGTDGMAY